MTGIIRSWICENRMCAAWFDSYNPNPECPKCKCVRVSWRPNGGHIGGAAKGADKELRALADIFRMGDINSAEAGRGAKKVSLPPPPPNSGPAMNFGGFAAVVDPGSSRTSENPSGAQCVPTANNFNVKTRAGVGQALGPGALGLPSVRTNTIVEATHKP
jgi:hypothetical protein